MRNKKYALGKMLFIALLLSYPITVLAATVVGVTNAFGAPFTPEWLPVWVFSAAGGFGAGFISVNDVDEKLNHPRLAKFVIGLFWGVAMCTALATFKSIPQSALSFFAILASCFSAPLCAGFMVYLSNQKRLNIAFDIIGKKANKDYVSVDEQRGDSNDDTSKL